MSATKIQIGFSPCPNDTFIFDALINKLIDTEGLDFEAVLEDVQTLNQWALAGKLDITKLSYGVLPLVANDYVLLNSGTALGRGVGPLLISKIPLNEKEITGSVIAIPGEHTTAHMLFSLAYPTAVKKVFLRYDEIENFVLEGKGLGVIIHENRFTYQDKGLVKITDLGDYWEKQTGHAIPLGGIAARRNMDHALQKKVDGLINKSIAFAFERYPELSDFIRVNSQEMREDVMRKHINLYVNEYSLHLGETGRAAIVKMMEVYNSTNIAQVDPGNIFLD